MNLDSVYRKAGAAGLHLTFALALVLVGAASSYAQYRDYGYRNDRVVWQKERTRDYALALGYHNSYSQGKEAAERGYRINYKDIQEYRDGTNGHLAWMGHPDTYRSNYRKGFELGFREGQSLRPRRYTREDVERILGANLRAVYGDDRYNHDDRRRNSGYYGDGRYGSRGPVGRNNGRYNRNEIVRIAQENGYREGLNHGREDRARRRSYNYTDASAYRDATRGYRSEYGDRETYRQAFREGYHRGYDEGYGRVTARRPWPF